MAHSSIVGGSNAGRLINCPASYQATRALPETADVPSEYAEEGTFAHTVMARIMNIRHASERRSAAPFNVFIEVRKWVGQYFYDRVLTQAHLDEMIEPALRQLAILENEHGNGFRVAGVELHVAFPGVPGAFGTCDLILINEKLVAHIDWKFGGGVPVHAVYRVDDGEIVNPQLLFYATAARASIKGLYKGKTSQPLLAIIQPRSETTPLTHVVISRKELDWFRQDLEGAVIAALDRDPPMQKGEWCRFAPCKVACPLWTKVVLDLSAIGGPPAKAVAREVTPYGEYLARAKNLADVLAMWKREVDEQLHSYLEDGGLVPGWRLKAKVKQRQWIDDDTVYSELTELGLSDDEIYQTKLGTFAQVEAAARRRGVKIPDHLRVAPATTETTVAPTDDPAPVIDRAGAAEAFQVALKALAAPST